MMAFRFAVSLALVATAVATTSSSAATYSSSSVASANVLGTATAPPAWTGAKCCAVKPKCLAGNATAYSSSAVVGCSMLDTCTCAQTTTMSQDIRMSGITTTQFLAGQVIYNQAYGSSIGVFKNGAYSNGVVVSSKAAVSISRRAAGDVIATFIAYLTAANAASARTLAAALTAAGFKASIDARITATGATVVSPVIVRVDAVRTATIGGDDDDYTAGIIVGIIVFAAIVVVIAYMLYNHYQEIDKERNIRDSTSMNFGVTKTEC